MGVYSIIANDASVGTTIGSFDAIDTRNGDIRLRDGTSRVVGISYCAVRAAQTAGTAMMARLRMTSADLGLAAGVADFALKSVSGAGIATTSMGFSVPAHWIPIDKAAGQGNIVNFSLSQMGIEPADNYAIQVGLSHLAGDSPPPPWFVASMSGGTLPHFAVSSNGSSTTTARTSLVAATIPSTFSQLVSGTFLHTPDAALATTEVHSSFIELTSTIGDFETQEYPTSGTSPGLGTAAAIGVWVEQDPLPLYFKKGRGSTQTVTPFVTGLVAVTGADAYGYDIGIVE